MKDWNAKICNEMKIEYSPPNGQRWERMWFIWCETICLKRKWSEFHWIFVAYQKRNTVLRCVNSEHSKKWTVIFSCRIGIMWQVNGHNCTCRLVSNVQTVYRMYLNEGCSAFGKISVSFCQNLWFAHEPMTNRQHIGHVPDFRLDHIMRCSSLTFQFHQWKRINCLVSMYDIDVLMRINLRSTHFEKRPMKGSSFERIILLTAVFRCVCARVCANQKVKVLVLRSARLVKNCIVLLECAS